MKQKGKATLLVRAPLSSAAGYRWLLIGRDGSRHEGVMTADEGPPLRELSCRTLLLLPASRCVMWRESLAQQKRQPSATALLWHREEHLLVDAEQLHAGYLMRTDTEAWLAAVEIRQLSVWLETLAHWGVVPDAIFPDVALLPVDECLYLDDEWLLRNGEMDARAIPGLALDMWPEADIVGRLRARQGSQGFQSMQGFSGPVPAGRGLLVGPFRPRMRLRALRGKRLIGAVLGLWLVSLAIFPYAQRWHLSRQNQAGLAQLRSLALRAFPELPDGAQLIPGLKEQLGGTVSSSGGLGDFLQRNQDILQQIEQGSVRGMRWDAGNRRLEFNLQNPPVMLSELAVQHSNPARVITLTPVKGRKMVNIRIQEQEQ